MIGEGGGRKRREDGEGEKGDEVEERRKRSAKVSGRGHI